MSFQPIQAGSLMLFELPPYGSTILLSFDRHHQLRNRHLKGRFLQLFNCARWSMSDETGWIVGDLVVLEQDNIFELLTSEEWV